MAFALSRQYTQSCIETMSIARAKIMATMLRSLLLICLACLPLAAQTPGDEGMKHELQRLHIPDKLMPKGKQPLFLVRAEGVQNYLAELKNDKLQWVFQAPEAVLFDYRTGEKVGTHSKGPIWVDLKGSKLTGAVLDKAPAANSSAVDWLLLETKNDNGGGYATVTHIQRVDTWAGKAPAIAPTKAGETKAVRYQATYVFLGDK
jgi:hypothetical protein